MSNPWLALQVGADPVERIGQVGRAHDVFVAAGRMPAQVRDVVADSWRRSAGALVDPDTTAPIDLSDDALADHRARHPLARALPLFRELLGGIADDGEHLMAVCDAHGRLLWVEGHAAVLRRAERMNFVPGARWDEPHAGTNAPGTALAVDHSVQIFATEHFSRPVQRWTCAAAPIHDPTTGRLLGAIDVTGGDHLANPHSLALVQATARAAESYLANLSATATPETPTVAALGRDEATLIVGGRRLRLGRRHSELLVLLLCHPEGRTGEQLGLDLYGDELLHPVTLRAELSRLRRLLGPALLDSRPYRLRVPLDADFHAVTRLLEQGRVAAALAAYPGPLLPASDAPGVTRLRRLVDGQLRAAVLASRDPALLDAAARSPWGRDDLQLWEALAGALPPGSPRRPLALHRARQLAAEYGMPPDATWLQRRRH
ncbi:GAF domain-containing protein [Micromonospora pattaloongensis]|uniref:GAF domain-containing protein n=1 Tax=Micromonospora pattaloongensis TaxID=405436 RepID=A0A1H3M762_9ACTN|nr:GAF domain-containing protein [Micromonospora pattaloongensis]SDY71845.1 GAF domain-containing protein [Micromonospora pattaloongensis]